MTLVLYVLVGLLALAAAAVLFILNLFYPIFRSNHVRLSVGVGTETEEFSIRSASGIPYLLEAGLPYPTHFDHSTRPMLSLSGEWSYLLDPRDEGEEAGWFRPETWVQETGNRPETINLPAVLNHSQSDIVDYLGAAWFARRFHIDGSWPEENRLQSSWQRLCLEGFLLRAAVWINGRFVTRREGGYTPLYADATPFLQAGENHICIRVDNRHTYTSLPPRLGGYHVPGWHTYLGIHRQLFIETLPAWSVVKVAADCRFAAGQPAGDGPGRLELEVLVHRREKEGQPDESAAECSLQAEVLSPEGGYAAGGTIELKESGPLPGGGSILAGRAAFAVESPQAWSPENPALYTVKLRLQRGDAEGRADEVLLRTGFREISTDRYGLRLNGQPLFLRGISKHEDHPELGAVNPPSLFTKDLDLIEELGANYVRLAHYPHTVAELTAARDRGLLLGEEIPYYQTGNGFANWYSDKRPLREFPLAQMGLRQLMDERLLRTAQRQLIEMVERDRNNPSIILWGVANESHSVSRAAARVYGWLREVVRVFDQSRPTTMAEFTTGRPLLDGRRRGCEQLEVLSVNLYLGWYYGHMRDVNTHIARLRRRFPDKPIIISEFGAGAAPGRSDADGVYIAERVPPGKTYSEEYQTRLIEHYVKTAEQLPYVTGVSPWVFADFYCTEFPSNPVANFNIKGLVNRDRQPKQAYRRLKALYTELRADGESGGYSKKASDKSTAMERMPGGAEDEQ
ncbi:MAG: glycoside hydrolase family 2 protein [Spirochaetota bacterium]